MNKGFLLGLIFLLACSATAQHLVLYQFGGYDLSILIDLSWRFANHQIPGEDFINTMPEILLILIKLVSYGNLSWTDLTNVNLAAGFFTFIFLIWISDSRVKSVFWGLSVAVVISLPIIYTNHIWHSSISQFAAVLFFLLSLRCR